MRCTACGCELLEGARFCGNCGKEITIISTETPAVNTASKEDAPVLEDIDVEYIEDMESTLEEMDVETDFIPEENDNLSKEKPQKEKSKQSLFESLPTDLDNIILPLSTKEIIKQTSEYKDILFKGDTSSSNVVNTIKQLYSEAYANKRIDISRNSSFITVTFDAGVTDVNGVPVSIGCRQKHTTDRWIVFLIGFAGANFTFNMNVHVHSQYWTEILNTLADMALKGEDWDYESSRNKGEKYILKQYFIFSFYKAFLDKLIVYSSNREYAVFNTGLVDNSYDDIYCCLKTNNAITDKKWQIDFFARWGKEADGKRLNNLFLERPQAPKYIDPEHLENIYFDVTKELYCDYEHIIRDNIQRLPLMFVKQSLVYMPEMNSYIAQCEEHPGNMQYINELKEAINNSDDSVRYLQNGLRIAVDTAKKYCSWNYKTAIPIFYPRNNKISLLLPLNLIDKNNADVALVVERLANGNYQGQTILTLDMAYLDARQICRPNSEWLTLTDISENKKNKGKNNTNTKTNQNPNIHNNGNNKSSFKPNQNNHNNKKF